MAYKSSGSNMEKGNQRIVGSPYEALSGDEENSPYLYPSAGIYDRPLPCCGCGIGWFSFLMGFIFPLLWYYATIRFFWTQRHNDPRERPGLAACAIAALVGTVTLVIVLIVLFVQHEGFVVLLSSTTTWNVSLDALQTVLCATSVICCVINYDNQLCSHHVLQGKFVPFFGLQHFVVRFLFHHLW